jgi:hypothetical protein
VVFLILHVFLITQLLPWMLKIVEHGIGDVHRSSVRDIGSMGRVSRGGRPSIA